MNIKEMQHKLIDAIYDSKILVRVLIRKDSTLILIVDKNNSLKNNIVINNSETEEVRQRYFEKAMNCIINGTSYEET